MPFTPGTKGDSMLDIKKVLRSARASRGRSESEAKHWSDPASVRVAVRGPYRFAALVSAAVATLTFAVGCSDEAPVSPLYSSFGDAASDKQAIAPEAEEFGNGGSPAKNVHVEVDDPVRSADVWTPPDPELSDAEPAYVPDIDHGASPSTPVGSTERVITDALGGQITHGKVRLDVPAGALDLATSTMFRVEIPAGNAFRINLYPHKAQFRKPVTLTIDLSDATNVGDHVALYWYDEDANVWKNVGGKYDPVTKTLVTKLNHFSTYAPGRAGWSGEPGKPELYEKD